MTGTIDASLIPVTEQAVVAIAVVEAFDTGVTRFVAPLARAGIVASLAGSANTGLGSVAELAIVTVAVV